MTVNSSRNALKRRTRALFMFFFLPGLLMASWATRTPAIRDILSVSIAEMGGVLFGLSIGSMSGILCSAWLVKRFGTRNVILGHDVLRIDRDDDIKSGTLADIAPALCRWSRRLWGKFLVLRKWR